MISDPRVTPARPDLAAEHLRGTVAAERYARPLRRSVAGDIVPLRCVPDTSAPYDTCLLHGEAFDVYDTGPGWHWGQSVQDGYVGYVECGTLEEMGRAASDRVAVLFSTVYGAPVLKSPPIGTLPFGARVPVLEARDGFARIGERRWLPAAHLRALDDPEPDWVAVAERFSGVPYVWGGRSAMGLDCSALVQLARQAAGHDCPRDSDMQEASPGETLPPDAALERGDLVFWRGHVGIMLDRDMLLHANAHHMAVAMEPLNRAVTRIDTAGGGPVTRRVRLDADTTNG